MFVMGEDAKFEIRAPLGKGGTGTVWDAVRRADGARVALKVIHDELAGDPQIRGRFLREAKILERLDGPFIGRLLEHGELVDQHGNAALYLALPLIDGPTLERVLDEAPDGLLEIGRALDILDEILRALSSAHAQGVIHRDLKPANVILENGEHVKVVDFGLAKIVTGGGTGTTNLTAHNMLFGTPEYMAPEQARGDDVDARADVYAAGVILYRLLTGTLPFTGDTPLAVLTAHLTSALVLPSERAPSGRVTAPLERVVVKALAREPERRFASADELAAALREARTASALPPRADDPLAATYPEIKTTEAKHTTQPSASFPPGQEPPKTPRSPRRGAPPSSSRPSRPSGPGRPSAAPPALPDGSLRTWILLCVLVGVASIAVGTALGLR